MSVKLKITVEPSTPIPEGKIFRCGTFFVKVSDDTYRGLMMISIEQGKDFQTVFVDAIKAGIENAQKGQVDEPVGPENTD